MKIVDQSMPITSGLAAISSILTYSVRDTKKVKLFIICKSVSQMDLKFLKVTLVQKLNRVKFLTIL